MTDDAERLEAHVDDTVAAICKVHLDHERAASRLQRVVDHGTALVGRPAFLGLLLLLIVGWILANLVWPRFGGGTLDAPPFAWMELVATCSALVMSVLILSTQRREDVLAEQRAVLTLELAMLNERKSAKIISLLEELRRDSPAIADRVDRESEAMAKAADPESVLSAIQQQREDGRASA